VTKKELKKIDPLIIAKIVFSFSDEDSFWSPNLGEYWKQASFFHGGEFCPQEVLEDEKTAKRWLKIQWPHWDRKRVKRIWDELHISQYLEAVKCRMKELEAAKAHNKITQDNNGE